MEFGVEFAKTHLSWNLEILCFATDDSKWTINNHHYSRPRNNKSGRESQQMRKKVRLHTTTDRWTHYAIGKT